MWTAGLGKQSLGVSERDTNPVHTRIFHIILGFNVLFEIVFADGITWLARCPLTHNCSSQDASDILMQSYAATLKYIKLNTSIPVPEVFACCTKLEKGNDVGSSYMLMERLPGHMLDVEDVEEGDERYETTRAAAKKVFHQLANFIMQLGIPGIPSTVVFLLY
jgi:aminoglycoside phosphotransferase (APT) family kinase protein